MGFTAIVVVVLAGCSASPAPGPVTFTPPAWFAQQAQEREEYRSGLQGCLDGRGWQVTVTADGGVAEVLTTDELARLMGDIDVCRQSMGLPVGDPPPATGEELGALYDKLVDTRACLLAQGVEMAAAPSRESWVDQMLAAQAADAAGSAGGDRPVAWHPFQDPELMELPEARQAELTATCPQPWATSW